MQKSPSPMEGSKPVHVEWRVEAVVNDDSHVFARGLQEILNKSAGDGFSLVSMMGHEPDKGLIVVHQKATMLVDSDAPTRVPAGIETGRLQ